MKNNNYLNFGAGNPARGWINIDSSPFFMIPKQIHKILAMMNISSRSDKYLSSNYSYYKFSSEKKLPFKNNSLSAIYTSHVLEHLSVTENKHFFNEAKRVLKRGGVLRVVVPNLEKKILPQSSIFSLENELLTLPQELKKNKVRAMLEAAHGFPSFHKSLFVAKFIKKDFSKNWKVRLNLKYLESGMSKNKLGLVEKKTRTKDALIFELVKK